MKIHEYQGKAILKEYGVPVPRGIVARTPDEAEAAARELGTAVVVVKAQIHAGGRGKGGGVKLAKSPEEAREIELHQNDPAAEKRQIERVQQVRKERDARRVQETLVHLRQAAQGTENLLPPIIEATRAYATIGEITRVLREVFGEFREPVTL